MYRIIFSFICFLFLSGQVHSQVERKKELLKLISESNNDSLKCLYYNELIESETDNSVWPSYNADFKAITLKHINLNNGKGNNRYFLSRYADALVNEGFLSQQTKQLSKALDLYKKALDIKLDLKSKKETSVILINIGFLFQETADYVKAYKYYKKALNIQEELNDKENAAITLMNLASISLSQDDSSQYETLVLKALEYRTSVQNKRGMARCYNALAVIEGNKPDRSKAFLYLKKAIEINEELHDKEGIGNSYNNLGGLYFREGNLVKSSEYYSKAYKVNSEVKDNASASTSLKNLGDIEYKKERFKQAHDFYLKALERASLSGNVVAEQNAAIALVRSSEALGLESETNSYRILSAKLRDSVEKKVTIQMAGLTRLLDPDSNTTQIGSLNVPKVDSEADSSSYIILVVGSVVTLICILALVFLVVKRKKGST